MNIKGKKYYFGWRKAAPDHRDYRYEEKLRGVTPPLPPTSDLRNLISQVKDQGQLGACTAHGTTSAFEALQVKRTGSCVLGSRLQVYEDTRILEGDYPGDNGGTIRGAVKSTAQYGVAPESMWPYDIKRFDKKIPADVAAAAVKDESTNYYLVDSTDGYNATLTNIKTVLAVTGLPVVFGTNVYEQIENVGPDGMIEMPGEDEAAIGGHCMLWVGHDDSKQAFLTLNSWGTSWGMSGYGWLPYGYVTNGIASDCWCIAAESELAGLIKI